MNLYMNSLAGFNAVENLMTTKTQAHFGDDPNDAVYQEGIVDYILSAFGSAGNSNFNSSGYCNPMCEKGCKRDHFTSAVNGYNLKYGNLKYLAAKSYSPSTGFNKYYNDSGILSE
jgi:hypothetical protein